MVAVDPGVPGDRLLHEMIETEMTRIGGCSMGMV
jgi:hypothetical protein